MSPPEFMLTICEELGIGVPDDTIGSVKDLVDILNRYLLRAHADGRRVVLVVDEAQNLPAEVLEQVRLLTNLETETQKLLQIILIGQPELRELLARNDLRQLAQRITGRYHLAPLSRAETSLYVQHRLRIAGATSEIFTPGGLQELYHVSGGVPRVINVISDRALLGGYTQDQMRIDAPMVRRAATEVFGRRVVPWWLPWSLGAACMLMLGVTAWVLVQLGPWGTAARDAAAATPSTVQGATPAPPSAAPAATPPAASATPAPATPGAMPALVPGAAPALTPGPGAATATNVDVGKLLAASGTQTTSDAAWTRLFSMWKAAYAPGTADACAQAGMLGLDCLSQRGSLAQLRLYNRPAILMLSDAAAMPHEVVIGQLDDASAWLVLGDAPQRVDLNDLSRYWYGDFVLLWKPASLDTRPLAMGMRGERVQALRQRLMQWQGLDAPKPGSELFDEPLSQLVAAFQRQHRLTVDGVAGLQTQVMLDAALPEAGTPLLRHE